MAKVIVSLLKYSPGGVPRLRGRTPEKFALREVTVHPRSANGA
jgi:hypothetical protein